MHFQKSHLPLGEDTCLLGVGGTIEASQLAAVVFPNRILTTVGARVVDDKGIVIAGTNEGEIIQVNNKAVVDILELIIHL